MVFFQSYVSSPEGKTCLNQQGKEKDVHLFGWYVLCSISGGHGTFKHTVEHPLFKIAGVHRYEWSACILPHLSEKPKVEIADPLTPFIAAQPTTKFNGVPLTCSVNKPIHHPSGQMIIIH